MKYKCYIFDLDGTIYFGNHLADKANEVIEKARNLSNHVFFVTNNSAKTKKEILDKLLALGINIKENELISASYAIAKYLKANNLNNIYCIGTNSLAQEIQNVGINSVKNFPEAIVVGYNPEFKLADLNELANIRLNENYKLIVANKERIYPRENGYILPGAASIVSAVEALLNKKSDIVIGKPNTNMLEIIISGLNYNPNDICVVGDSYNSDIIMAKNYGANGILITQKTQQDCQCIGKLSELLEMME